MEQLTVEQLKAKVTDFAKQKQALLYNLKDRWADEKEYEDFQDYIKVMKEAAAKFGLALASLTKTFNLTFNATNGTVILKVGARGMNLAWKQNK